jgi:hypothetical protein
VGLPPVVFSLQDCVVAVRAADVDSNILLDQTEYLQLVVILSGCNLITALSEAQFDLFKELACLCEKDPRFVAGCCSPDQRKVLVDQDAAIQNVCVKTRNVIAPGCVQSPTNPVDPSLPAAGPGVAPSVVSPASPPLSLPAIGPSAPALFPETTMLAVTPTIAGAVPRTKAPIALISESLECQNFLDQSNGRLTYEGFLAFVINLSGCKYDRDSLPIPLRAVFVRLSRDQADIDLVGRADPGFVSRRAQVCYEIIEGIGGTTCQEDQPQLMEQTPKIPLSVLDSCASLIKEVDANGDELLDKDEFHHFLGSYGDCTIQALDYGHMVAFYNFACKCHDDVSYDRELCCYPNPVAAVNLTGVGLPVEQRSESQARQLTEVCDVAIGLTANRTCEALPQIPDPVLGDSECSALIVQADANADQRLNRSEYLRFIQLSDDGCADYLALPTYHTYIFGLLSCGCIFEGGGVINPFCCLYTGATINIAGANMTVDERSDYQKSTIAVLCEVTRVAAEFGCRGNATAVQRGTTTAVNTSFLLVPASSGGRAMSAVVVSGAAFGAMAIAALFTLLF